MQVIPFKVFVPNDKVEQATNVIRASQQQAVALGRISNEDAFVRVTRGENETAIQTQVRPDDFDDMAKRVKDVSVLIRVVEEIIDGLKRIGNELEDAAKAVGNGVEDAAKTVGNAAEDVGRGIANVARKLWPF